MKDARAVAKAVDEIAREFPAMQNEFAKQNQVYLATGVVLNSYQVFSTKEVSQISDLEGMKVAGAGMNLRYLEGIKDAAGVRGVRLKDGQSVVSMFIIRHFDATADERAAYLKMRRAMAGWADDAELDTSDDEGDANFSISQERYAEMSAVENLILTLTVGGAGKLSSSHDYPVRGRGGMGVTAMDKAMRGGDIVASFPVEMDDQIMLATSKGQSIRVPVEGISFRSRSAGGVKVFNTGKNEVVVSVAYIADQTDDDEEQDGETTAE